MTDKKRVPNYVYGFLVALFMLIFLSNCSHEHKNTYPFGKDTTYTNGKSVVTIMNLPEISGMKAARKETIFYDTIVTQDTTIFTEKRVTRFIFTKNPNTVANDTTIYSFEITGITIGEFTIEPLRDYDRNDGESFKVLYKGDHVRYTINEGKSVTASEYKDWYDDEYDPSGRVPYSEKYKKLVADTDPTAKRTPYLLKSVSKENKEISLSNWYF